MNRILTPAEFDERVRASLERALRTVRESPTPAEFAKARLLEVVEQDRARDNVWRWRFLYTVRTPSPLGFVSRSVCRWEPRR